MSFHVADVPGVADRSGLFCGTACTCRGSTVSHGSEEIPRLSPCEFHGLSLFCCRPSGRRTADVRRREEAGGDESGTRAARDAALDGDAGAVGGGRGGRPGACGGGGACPAAGPSSAGCWWRPPAVGPVLGRHHRRAPARAIPTWSPGGPSPPAPGSSPATSPWPRSSCRPPCGPGPSTIPDLLAGATLLAPVGPGELIQVSAVIAGGTAGGQPGAHLHRRAGPDRPHHPRRRADRPARHLRHGRRRLHRSSPAATCRWSPIDRTRVGVGETEPGVRHGGRRRPRPGGRPRPRRPGRQAHRRPHHRGVTRRRACSHLPGARRVHWRGPAVIPGERFVVLGLAPPRAAWFRSVGRVGHVRAPCRPSS